MLALRITVSFGIFELLYENSSSSFLKIIIPPFIFIRATETITSFISVPNEPAFIETAPPNVPGIPASASMPEYPFFFVKLMSLLSGTPASIKKATDVSKSFSEDEE